MKLVTFTRNGIDEVGVKTDGGLVPLSELASDLPKDMIALISEGEELKNRIDVLLTAYAGQPLNDEGLELRAPIPTPARNIFCVGKNYHDHAEEFEKSGFDSSSSGQAVPSVPIIFTKAPSSVIAHGESVDSSLDPSGTLDYEGELAVVIGKGGRGITKDAAMAHVYGYTIINDVTARETQNKHKQWFLGKSADTFCPMGPAIVTADEIGDVRELRLTTKVNGELRQNAVVSDLIFDIPTIIETISSSITLQPGDLIATGTPVGVAIGFNPPKYLQPGDEVEVEITKVGSLRNRIS